jgi:hypothetical protein
VNQRPKFVKLVYGSDNGGFVKGLLGLWQWQWWIYERLARFYGNDSGGF